MRKLSFTTALSRRCTATRLCFGSAGLLGVLLRHTPTCDGCERYFPGFTLKVCVLVRSGQRSSDASAAGNDDDVIAAAASNTNQGWGAGNPDDVADDSGDEGSTTSADHMHPYQSAPSPRTTPAAGWLGKATTAQRTCAAICPTPRPLRSCNPRLPPWTTETTWAAGRMLMTTTQRTPRSTKPRLSSWATTS